MAGLRSEFVGYPNKTEVDSARTTSIRSLSSSEMPSQLLSFSSSVGVGRVTLDVVDLSALPAHVRTALTAVNLAIPVLRGELGHLIAGITAFEVGAKARVAGINLAAAAYAYKYTDIQVSAYSFVGTPPTLQLTRTVCCSNGNCSLNAAITRPETCPA